MTGEEFDRIVEAAGLKSASIGACRRVLVYGMSINSAAREADISPAAVSRMLQKFPIGVCEACGQAIPPGAGRKPVKQ